MLLKKYLVESEDSPFVKDHAVAEANYIRNKKLELPNRVVKSFETLQPFS